MLDYEDLPCPPSPARQMANALFPGIAALGRSHGIPVSTDFDFDETVARYKFRHHDRRGFLMVFTLFEDQLLNPDHAQITKTIALALEAQLETLRRLKVSAE